MTPLAAITTELQGQGRDVTLCAVSKQQPVAAIEALISAGHFCFGESRVQEAAEKFPTLKAKHPALKLHLIGSLQTNKVKAALELFDVIETLDRPELITAIAHSLSRLRGRAGEGAGEGERASIKAPQFFIQINTGNEPQKSGATPPDLPMLLKAAKGQGLNVTGLMCIPPQAQHPAPHFAFLYELARRHGLPHLSMGMSNDYKTALQLGTTEIRLGTALFGPRENLNLE